MKVIDTHIHLFEKPYSHLFDNAHVRDGAAGEVRLFEEYQRAFDVEEAFVICHEDGHCPDNNRFVRSLVAERDWILSFGHLRAEGATLAQAGRSLIGDGHFGLSCYPPRDRPADWMAVPELAGFYAFLEERCIPLSLNISADQCGALAAVLADFPGLTLLISHMARPRLLGDGLDEAYYASLLGLARYPHVYVKLSGFYAFVDEGWRFPQQQLFCVVDRLKAVFGAARLLFASDFAPVLEHNTYRQSLELLRSCYRGFSDEELEHVYYRNAQQIISARRTA